MSNLPTDAVQLTAWNDWKQRYTSYDDVSTIRIKPSRFPAFCVAAGTCCASVV